MRIPSEKIRTRSARAPAKRAPAKGAHARTAIPGRILAILGETGGIAPAELAERLNLPPADLERHIAALRHMEKVRGELRDGRKFIRLW